MAIGDSAAAAGMSLVDGVTTPANTIDDEINRTRDYIATGTGATVAAAAGKVVKRDAAGRAQFATPAAAQDAATKAYVDAQAPGPGSIGNTQLADNAVTTGKIAPDTIVYDDLHPDLERRLRDGAWDIALDILGLTVQGNSLLRGNATVNGHVFVPNSSAAVSGYTVAYINTDGRLSRGASSERYKKYLSEIDPVELGDIWPSLTRYQMRQGDGSWKYGYIAERLAEHPDQQPFVVYAEHEGTLVPESIDFIALLMAQNAQLHQQLDLLAQRLDQIEAAR